MSCALVAIGCVNASPENLAWKSGWQPADTSQTDRLAAEGLWNLVLFDYEGHSQANCSLADAAVRKEWYASHGWLSRLRLIWSGRLSHPGRGRLIAMPYYAYNRGHRGSQPPIQPWHQVLKVGKSHVLNHWRKLTLYRYDDFVAVHINNTLSIHATVSRYVEYLAVVCSCKLGKFP